MAEQPPPSLQHTLLDVHRRSWPPNLPFPVAELQEPQPEPEPEPEQQADPGRPLSPLTQELRLIIRVSDVRESASRVRREAMPLGGAPEEETAGARARRRDGEGLSMFDGPEEKLKRGRGGGARLRMRVIEAEGLISRDSNGRSDPFASVHVDGSTWRTKTIERTLAPVWSEEAKEPPITSADAVVHVILFDQDGMMKKSDYQGFKRLFENLAIMAVTAYAIYRLEVYPLTMDVLTNWHKMAIFVPLYLFYGFQFQAFAFAGQHEFLHGNAFKTKRYNDYVLSIFSCVCLVPASARRV